MNPQQFTIEDFLKVKAAISPQFSPDGTHVAYLSNEAGTLQLYRTPVMGGDVVQLTNFPDVLSEFVYSPTEEVIAFSKSVGGSERDQLFLLDVATKEIRELTQSPTVKYSLGSFSADGKLLSYASTERNNTDFDVYVLDVHAQTSRRVFDLGGWCGARMFSPSGRYLAVDRVHHNENADVYVCDLETSEVACVTTHTGDVYFEAVGWATDENKLFLATNAEQEFVGLHMYNLQTKQSEQLVLGTEGDVDCVAVDRTKNQLVVAMNEGGYSRVDLYDAGTLERFPLVIPRGQVRSLVFSRDGKSLAFAWGDATHTFNVRVMTLVDSVITQLTQSAQGVPSEVLVDPELVSFPSYDGLEVSAFVYAPRAKAARTPVIIDIHGGPMAQHRPNLLLLIQYFVYAGYMVVAPNVRGSSGYGKTFAALDNVEKRLDSVKDIVALREFIARRYDWTDVRRCVVMGGSYGGFMVLACLAFYPELWAAGVDIVGIANFVTFLENTAEYRRANREQEYGSLTHHRELLEQISPIHAAHKIQVPLFVIHGANDPRVPLSEAQQIVEKVRGQGKPAELLVYEDEGHGLAKLQNKLDAYPKVAEFLQKVLQN